MPGIRRHGEYRKTSTSGSDMFGKIGIWQLVVIFGIFVVLFGYKKVPEIGKTLGQGLRNFRRSMNEADEVDITPTPEEKAQSKDDETNR